MKNRLLFVIDSLDCAGAEKSLVTLLGLLDYRKFEVDLMLFAHGRELERLVPREVNILQPLKYTVFSNLPLRNAVLAAFKQFEFRMLTSRLKFSTALRKRNYNNAQKARLYWQNTSRVIEFNTKQYDVAISYAQGVPTFYVAEKVKAKNKLAWVNVSYRLDETESQFQQTYYNKFNKIVAVSDSAKHVFLETFPKYQNVMEVIYDINNPSFIHKMANSALGYDDEFRGTRLLTIGRLAHQKGYDVAIKACKILKDSGLNFRWYVLGKGPLQKEMEEEIKKNELIEHFILLGVKANPYPFIRDADIYVQTSRYEGFGIAIAEARMLNTPVVTTRFDAVFNQMVDGKNGLVVERDAEAVCKAIISLVQNEKLRKEIITYLTNEKKGNVEEIEKFYQLIG